MRARAWTAAVAAAGVLSGCQTPMVGNADRHLTCGAAVAMPPDAVVFKPNPWADPVAGPAMGAGVGALSLIAAVTNPLMILLAPVAVVTGIECAEGARKHPTADSDFRRIFATADSGALSRALAQQLDGESCRMRSGDAKATVVVERVEAMPGCAGKSWGYGITIFWHANRPDGSALVPSRKLRCGVFSERDVDAWFADPATSRDEVESALAALGRRLGADLASSAPPDEICDFNMLKGKAVEQASSPGRALRP